MWHTGKGQTYSDFLLILFIFEGATQEGWDAAPAPVVPAPIVEGGAPVVASGWDM